VRHAFTERYTVELVRGERVTHLRCAWCGMGKAWAGADDACSGSMPDMLRRPEQCRTEARARAKLISQHRAEVRYAARAALVGVVTETQRDRERKRGPR